MKKLNLIVMLLIVGLILGCGPRVATQKTTSKDLGNYDSFAYLPNSNVNAQNLPMDSEDVSRAVIEAVNMNMREVGYNLDRQNPDLLVLISTETDTELETTTDAVYATYPYTAGVSTINPLYNNYYYGGYAGYNNIIGYDTDTYAYEEGTVVINLVDRESRNTVWKGVASESLSNQSNIQEIRGLVNAIFEEYPLNN
ncbi:DUF4136 domain-containing protein [Salinimicrobium tongyeongense]|uniref:DUF4136 domain-containing protein n=1 Tax=Salinimicrobium tongyeongense TaxID=2809707 RepID=A0ABY6NNV4_9FLAO|nr:DUF4136 domain-containing protein [Salinimicrobium tongyeongense]UZH54518.1 DUF4136 domain-containing protein [Salinimicrobium tongyeongense]